MYDEPESLNLDLNGSFSSIYLSLSRMNSYGWTNPEEYILECVKSGRLCQPFLINACSGTNYADRMIARISSIVNAIRQAIALKNLREQVEF